MVENKGFVRIPEHKLEWLPLLRDLYRFEETLVSGPGSHKRRFSDVIWTKKAAISSLNLDEIQITDFEQLLEYLAKERQLMVVPLQNSDETKYLTRVAELVRTVGHTYEYWSKGRPAVSATRWLVEDKKVPNLVIPAEVFIHSIINKCEQLIPGDAGYNLRKASEEVCVAVAKSINKDEWEKVHFSEFQLEATLKILQSRYGESIFKSQVLTAGVGSGKTIAFSIATLIEARKTMLDGKKNNNLKSTGLFVYPRTQLAIDQHQELEKFAKHMDCDLKIWLEMSQAYKSEKLSVAQGVPEKYSEHSAPFGIIVTTFETLKRRMRRPEFMLKLSKHLSTIVLDEVHLLSGIGGGMSSQLLARLAESVSHSVKNVHWIGASATIARPDVHGSRLFGMKPDEVQVIAPRESEMVQAGINHHIFIRPTQGMSLIGALVNVTSLTLHQRRGDLSKRSDRSNDKVREKSIGFADNLEMLGRWNDDFRENERTQNVMRGRKHPDKGIEIKNWNETQREIPYAWRFNKPLQRRLATHGGNDELSPGDSFKDLRTLFDGDQCSKVCDSCRKGEQVTLGEIQPDDLLELKKIVYRTHHRQDDKISALQIDSNEFTSAKGVVIGSHELCPFLQAGACLWFPEPDTDAIYEIPGSKTYPKIEFAAVGRSSVFSSKTPGIDSEDSEEMNGITSKIFRDTTQAVFDVKGSGKRVPVDIILASPSLEVGVDLPMLTESVLVKSVRNIASYRQKVGRVGRERNLDTVNVTLMTEASTDLHYYRQPRKLVSEGRLEPVPLMEHNKAIIACSAYSSIWEWLALHADLPEYIQGIANGTLGKRLQSCLDEMAKNSIQLRTYIGRAIKNPNKHTDLIDEAIQQVREEIGLLVLPVQSTYNIQPPLNYEAKVIDLFGIHALNKVHSSHSISKRHEQVSGNLDKIESHTKSIIKSLQQILQSSDKIPPSSIPKLNDCEDSLNKKVPELEELNSTLEILNSLDISRFDEDGQDAIDDGQKYIKRLIRDLEKVDQAGINQDVVSLFDDYTNIDAKDEQGQQLVNGGFWKRVYLSDTMDNLSRIQILRRNSWFLRPNTLFENPYTKKVSLSIKNLDNEKVPTPLDASQAEITVNEAIYAFMPGTWNLRIPHRRFKVVTGELHPSGGTVVAKLDRMISAGNRFRKVHDSSLPPPPGCPESLQIHAPTHLSMIESFAKYVDLNKNTLQVMDKDESIFDSPAKVTSKLPKSFQNRWAWSPRKEGSPTGAFLLPNHIYQLEHANHSTSNLEHSEGLKHPMCNSLLESIEWHDEKEVIEYTYGLSRSFGAKGEINLAYKDQHDRNIGFGEKYLTEALSFNLNPSIIKSIQKKFRFEIENESGKVSPSIIKSFKAFVLTDTDFGGATINPHALEGLISALLIFNDWRNTAVTPKIMSEFIRDAHERAAEFRPTMELFIRTQMKLNQKYDVENPEQFESDSLVDSRVRYSLQILDLISNFVNKFDGFLDLWIHRTILSTFGVVATNSMQQFCGSDENDVGYLIEEDSWSGESTRIVVYDKAEFGNGTCSTARDYLHIPHVVRTSRFSERSKLPTSDYLSTLEENLLQCLQHQSDLGALVLLKDPDLSVLSSMPDLVKHAKENFEVGNQIWEKLGVKSMDDAWTLPLHVRLAAHYDSQNKGMAMDDTTRSSTICWNGCPECVNQLQNTLGGMLGMNFIDKYVLDEWFHEGVAKSDDYQYLDFEEISNGKADMHFGSLNSLHLITPDDESKRSICLPWTMGFHMQRESPFRTRLIVRSTDLSGLRIGDNLGPALGIEGHGFERLLWFNLLMTSHLDAVGALSEEKKEIQLLYYDARDLQLKDIGLSPRMLDSMSAVSDGEPLEKLSDVLRWMLHRGFKITLCIDKNQATNLPVRDFLHRIADFSGMTILQRSSEKGSMHKKILISPIAVMTGSANLTFSGSNLNDESINHTTSNNKSQYESVLANARTTLKDAESFDFNYVPKYSPNSSKRTHKANKPVAMDEISQIIMQLENGTFDDETRTIEFKSCYGLPNPDRNMTEKDTADVGFREVASMMNSDGGHVLFGIEDKTWDVLGIGKEISSCSSRDAFLGKIKVQFNHNIGSAFSDFVSWQIKDISGKQVLIISSKPSLSKKVWFKPRGKHFEKDVLDKSHGAIYNRSQDHVNPLRGITEICDWAEARFGKRNIE